MDWFLYDRDFHRERVKISISAWYFTQQNNNTSITNTSWKLTKFVPRFAIFKAVCLKGYEILFQVTKILQ